MRFLFSFYRFKAVGCTTPHIYIKQYLNQFVNTLQYGSTCIYLDLDVQDGMFVVDLNIDAIR